MDNSVSCQNYVKEDFVLTALGFKPYHLLIKHITQGRRVSLVSIRQS